MKKSFKGQTGPKTESGKKVVSKNAQKTGIFTQGYLPTENVTQKQNEFEQLCKEWTGYSVGRKMILRSIEQASLGIERMMVNEKIILEGSLQSLDIASEFCSMADIDHMRAHTLPKWFFSADEDVMSISNSLCL